MLPSLFFGLFLIALASVLLVMHALARRAAEHGKLSERDLVFARRRYRRRLHVCLLLAVVGAGLIGGNLMNHPLLAGGYWLCVVVLVGWIGLLAMTDLMDSRLHFRTLRDEHTVEHTALKAELAKYLAEQGADSAADSCPPRKSGV